jgi:organic radical activating enzyme
VVETFHSLQGEGLHAGRSAFFIRLAGCTVGCPWCDTKHSWPETAHPHRPISELATEARQAAAAGAAFVVISGGEPLQQPLDPLCEALSAAGLPLHLETSGVGCWSGRFDWITLSPKRHAPPSGEALAACAELKVVVHEPADLEFATAMALAARPGGSVCRATSGWGCAEGVSDRAGAVAGRPAPPASAARQPTGPERQSRCASRCSRSAFQSLQRTCTSFGA